MQDAINKGEAICELDFPGRAQRPSPHISPVVNAFFAYGTDLTTPHAELERYVQLDASALTDPVVKAICVIGSGYWYFHRSRRAWVYHPATPKFDEVIDFVSGVVNSLLQQPPFERVVALDGRGRASLSMAGEYIVNPPSSRVGA